MIHRCNDLEIMVAESIRTSVFRNTTIVTVLKDCSFRLPERTQKLTDLRQKINPFNLHLNWLIGQALDSE